MTTKSESVYLVKRDGRIDYTTTITPEYPRTVKAGITAGIDGDFLVSRSRAAELNSQLRAVGPTITLCEAGVKVSAHTVECLAGPFPMRSEPSDSPEFPKMTRTVITTPNGEVCWSNLRSTHVLPDGRTCDSLAGALAMTMDVR